MHIVLIIGFIYLSVYLLLNSVETREIYKSNQLISYCQRKVKKENRVIIRKSPARRYKTKTAPTANLLDLLQQHDGLIVCRACKKTWHHFWFATIWVLWLHRNAITFNQASIDFEKVTDLIKTTVWCWSNGLLKKGRFSFVDWCLDRQTCIQYDLYLTLEMLYFRLV